MTAAGEETWLFDLGNSRAKAARLGGGRPVDAIALEWEQPDFAGAFRQALGHWPQPGRALVASVAPAARAAPVRDALAGYTAARVEWLRTPRQAGGVINRYAKPERLGIDRFLAMVAARARTGDAACAVVGCGTALTLDALTADGTHAEGLIALAPAGMLKALQGATAIADSNADAFAEDTHDDTALALRAGCRAAAGALVEWFAARSRTRHGIERVWLHGGWAAELADWLDQDGHPAAMLDDAVLRGLAVLASEAP